MPVMKTSRVRRSKAAVQEELQVIAEQLAKEKNETSIKSNIAIKMQENAVCNAVSEITVEVIAQKISDLNVEISKSLSSISEKMAGEVNLLNVLKEAIALEEQELHNLHNIDIAATSIDQLLADYTEKKINLESEIEKIRIDWEKENAAREFELKEHEENLIKSRQRENDEYEYKKTQERKKKEDKFDEEFRLKQKEAKEKLEILEKSWQERETLIKTKEDEFLKMQKEIEAFPTKLISEREKAISEAKKEAEDKFLQQIVELKHALTSEKQIADLKIKNMQETNDSLQNQLLSLQNQLNEAKKQVQDIAIRAIEGASGAKALSHINQIAIEQAKNRGTPS